MKLIAVFLVLIFLINETIGFSEDSSEDIDKSDDNTSRERKSVRDERNERHRKKPKRRLSAFSKWDDDFFLDSEERVEESKRNRKKTKKRRPHSFSKWDYSSPRRRSDDDTTRDTGERDSERDEERGRNRYKPKKRIGLPPKVHVDKIDPVTGNREITDGEVGPDYNIVA